METILLDRGDLVNCETKLSGMLGGVELKGRKGIQILYVSGFM